ncbi:MAG: glutamate synthase [Anaerolineae bacterium]|nr:glutamate synthase [Anaerolineae bacterium]
MDAIEKIIASRQKLPLPPVQPGSDAAEGGCGVIGIACSAAIPARHLLQSLIQMRNRGNGKGGGVAAVGLAPEEMGVSRAVLEEDYLLTVAYLDESARAEVERDFIEATFEIDHTRYVERMGDYARLDLAVRPPEVYQYFVRVKPSATDAFRAAHGMADLPQPVVEDEIVYQNTFRLNRAFYASTSETRAFVLSHGKNMFVLKMVGYGDDVVYYYRLEDIHAHVWIGHHRYPTKGRVWHPGGAHPFVGLHEALVHNGDFANYAGVSEYLAQRDIYPLFLTDTEVSVLVFDLLHRTYGYPLEYVIEALAPTTERDFTLLPLDKQKVYHAIQTTHIHGSPDGPWFFLIAQSQPKRDGQEAAHRLLGITDTSMLRPQVFALQQGNGVSIGFAASEKQGIDAALQSLAAADSRFWGRADRYWNARGGSHTDGGAFIFTVQPGGSMVCTDKFGRAITADVKRAPYYANGKTSRPKPLDLPASGRYEWIVERLPGWGYDEVRACLAALEPSDDRAHAIETLTRLMDRHYPTGKLRRSSLLALYDQSLSAVVKRIREAPDDTYVFAGPDDLPEAPAHDRQIAVIDARGFPPQGYDSLAMALVKLYMRGFKRFIVAQAQGHRFIGNGFGANSAGVRIDVYGSPGDYLGSGIDGAAIYVHGNAQDQVAQITKEGKLVIYGDVGQTFGYAMKGGEAYILGNAAGRPMINAVGRPRIVINGTCLDYLAESFMAGDPLNGGGFVILNGVAFNDDGDIVELDTPYPGGNLFSLASGGAIYVRDPYKKVSTEQLNGGEFVPLRQPDWETIQSYLEENERLFGIPAARLLAVEGQAAPPAQVYRKIAPVEVKALRAEEAWVKKA